MTDILLESTKSPRHPYDDAISCLEGGRWSDGEAAGLLKLILDSVAILKAAPLTQAVLLDAATDTTMSSARHSCMACPVEVRNIGAVLHNLVGQIERNETVLQPRTVRKLTSAREALARWQPIIDAHFAAVRAEKGGTIGS